MTGQELTTIRQIMGLEQSSLGELLDLPADAIGRMERDEETIDKRTALAVRYLALGNLDGDLGE